MTCAFAEPILLDGDEGPALHCRRYPPVVYYDHDDPDPGVAQTWPQMHEWHWCGEWVHSGDVDVSGAHGSTAD